MNREQRSGITLLLASRIFERVAFYLLMSVLILYLTESLQSDAERASWYYSILIGTIGFTTVLSGLAGDLWDRTKIVVTGFVLLSAAYLALAVLPDNCITAVLIMSGLGIGLTLPNMIVFLGNIYCEKENELTGLPGFILLSAITELGALCAPTLSASLRSREGYDAVFLASFISALIALFLFLRFRKYYNRLPLMPEQKDNKRGISIRKLHTFILVSVLVTGVIIRFGLEQNITFSFALKDLPLNNSIVTMKTIVGNGKILSLFVLILFAFVVTRIRRMSWEKTFNIIVTGITLAIISYLAVVVFKPLSRVISGTSLFIESYTLWLIATALISPTLLYIVYRSSPVKFKGLFQGVSYSSIAAMNSFVFFGPKLYDKNGTMAFSFFILILLAGAIMTLFLKKIVKDKLAGIEKSN